MLSALLEEQAQAHGGGTDYEFSEAQGLFARADENTNIKLTYELLNAPAFSHLKSAFLKDLDFRKGAIEVLAAFLRKPDAKSLEKSLGILTEKDNT